MFFSVIIPAHNAAKTIEKTIASIKSQSFTDYEIIVICDACEDNTVDIVAHCPNVRHKVVNNHTDGLTRNVGIDMAQGEYLLFIDADDWYLHQFVFQQIHDKIVQCNHNHPDKPLDMLVFGIIWNHVGYAGPRSPQGTLYTHCVNKAWRREFVGDTRFPDKKVANDAGFQEKMLAKNPVMVEWEMPIYYYDYLADGSKSVSLGRTAEKTIAFWRSH